ncbi:MAG: thermonuclease family protein [Bosea sp. (in: a-proteobacteria)]
MRSQSFIPYRQRFRGRRLTDWLAGAGALVLLVMGARYIEQRWSAPDEVAGFGEAIDGDSLKLAGQEIRLKGIDAPELSQYCQNKVGRDYACGVEAKKWLRAHLQRGAVVCAVEGRDRYGRLLGVCRRGEIGLNATMVREGIAVDYGDYPTEQAQARRQQTGLWSGKFMMPSEYRATHPRS